MGVKLLCSLVNLTASNGLFIPLYLLLSKTWQVNILLGTDIPLANALNASSAVLPVLYTI